MPMNKIFGPLSVLFLALIACGPALQGCASSGVTSTVSVKSEASILEAGRKPIALVCRIDTLIPDEDVSHISHALAPLIRRDLFCVQKISVVPTADTDVSTNAYFLKNAGLKKLARAHGADVIIVGLLRGDSESVKVELKAFDVERDRSILEIEIEAKTSILPKLQKELVHRLIEGLGIELTEEERERLAAGLPRESEAIIEYGRGLKGVRQEDDTEALIAYRNAVGADESFALPYAAEASVFKRMNAPQKAMKSLEKALAIDPFYAEGWYRLNIYATRKLGRDDLAMEYCRSALEISPLYGKAHLSLGTRMYALGDLDGAFEETTTAVELLRVDPLPRYNLGVYYRDSGDTGQARMWFERALKIDPGFELARVALLNLPRD
jgi:tetratricopeptide (TPR) repeat protein